jgi:hypothetical protein
MNRVDFHPSGPWSAGVAPAIKFQNVPASRQRSALARGHACRPDHIDYAGYKAEQKEHDQSEGRCRQQTVETPANHRSDDNARDQLRGKLETARHCRSSRRAVTASCAGLVSPDFSAVPDFGQPVFETSEPCGKRSFIGGRLIAISGSAAVGVFSHAETLNDAAIDGNYAATLKSRADHTYRV